MVMVLSFHPCCLGDTQVILGDGTLDSYDLGHIRAAEAIILPQNCPLDLYQACGTGTLAIWLILLFGVPRLKSGINNQRKAK